MLLLCSLLISEQVFFLYINPTCTHTHMHTQMCSPSLSLHRLILVAAMQMAQRDERLAIVELQQGKTRYNGGCLIFSVFTRSMLLFNGAKCSIVQQSGTTFTSNTEIMTGCQAVFTLGLNQNSVPLPSFSRCLFTLSKPH